MSLEWQGARSQNMSRAMLKTSVFSLSPMRRVLAGRRHTQRLRFQSLLGPWDGENGSRGPVRRLLQVSSLRR